MIKKFIIILCMLLFSSVSYAEYISPIPHYPLPRPEVNCSWKLVVIELSANVWDWKLLVKAINNSVEEYEEWEIVWLNPESEIVIIRVRECEPITMEDLNE